MNFFLMKQIFSWKSLEVEKFYHKFVCFTKVHNFWIFFRHSLVFIPRLEAVKMDVTEVQVVSYFNR